MPQEVFDLYAITGGGGAYGWEILPPRLLPGHNEYVTEIFDDYELMDDAALPWGPAPVGDSVVALADGRIPVFVAEHEGQPAGVTALDAGGDEGYHWMAPSLEALFTAWLALTERGFGSAGQDMDGNTTLHLRDSDDVTKANAAIVCQEHGCSRAAFGVWYSV